MKYAGNSILFSPCSEDIGYRKLLCIFLGELFCPCHALVCVGSFASIVILSIAHKVCIFLPIVPSSRSNALRKVAIHKDGMCIFVTSGARVIWQLLKIYPYCTFCGVEAAVMYELTLQKMSQFSNHAVEGPKIKSVVPSI